MKMILDDKDRSRPWYKGMVNMSEEDIDEWWKGQLRSIKIIIMEMLVIAMFGVICYFLSDDKQNILEVIYTLIGFDMALGMVILVCYDGNRKRMRLLKEERGL